MLPRQHVLERQPVPEQEDVVEGERRVREARGQHVQQRRAHLVHDGPHQLLGHRAAARRQPRLRVRVFREMVSRRGWRGAMREGMVDLIVIIVIIISYLSILFCVLFTHFLREA